MKTRTITCMVERVSDKYVARCATYTPAIAFGETEDDACDNLAESVGEYVKLFPEKAARILDAPTREVSVGE